MTIACRKSLYVLTTNRMCEKSFPHKTRKFHDALYSPFAPFPLGVAVGCSNCSFRCHRNLCQVRHLSGIPKQHDATSRYCHFPGEFGCMRPTGRFRADRSYFTSKLRSNSKFHNPQTLRLCWISYQETVIISDQETDAFPD